MPLSLWTPRRRTHHTGKPPRTPRSVARTLRSALLGAGLLAAIWPGLALANPARPPWQPGPPWAPLAPMSGEVNEISNLFWIILVLSGIIFFGVVAAVVVSIMRFSHKEGAPEPTQVFGNRRVEMIWTIIPTIILALAFIATVKAMNDINNPNTTGQHAVFDINAVGHQWWWEFQYPHQNFVTADEVHVPTGVYVRFHVESNDVIHSFWTPQLQRQIDANPGIDNVVYLKADRPGIYSGMCYEYCGEGHAWMKFKEIVDTPGQFAAWVKHEQQDAAVPKTSLLKYGQSVFLHNTCVNCHAITGTLAGGAVGPNLTHLASRWGMAGGAAPITQIDLEHWIQDPYQYKSGVIMPAYPTLSHKDLHALASYLLSLK